MERLLDFFQASLKTINAVGVKFGRCTNLYNVFEKIRNIDSSYGVTKALMQSNTMKDSASSWIDIFNRGIQDVNSVESYSSRAFMYNATILYAPPKIVTSLRETFAFCSSLIVAYPLVEETRVSLFSTFDYCTNLQVCDISNLTVIGTLSSTPVFRGCTSLNTLLLGDLSEVTTIAVDWIFFQTTPPLTELRVKRSPKFSWATFGKFAYLSEESLKSVVMSLVDFGEGYDGDVKSLTLHPTAKSRLENLSDKVPKGTKVTDAEGNVYDEAKMYKYTYEEEGEALTEWMCKYDILNFYDEDADVASLESRMMTYPEFAMHKGWTIV